MNSQPDYLLQLTQLSELALSDLSPSFNRLPKTEHADGQYRLRRYSVVRLQQGEVEHLPTRDFVQSAEINHFQGNISRSFETLEDELIASQGMKEMCQLFQKAKQLTDEQEIEIHQIRIATGENETPVAPEGVHQDGFNHLAVVSIGRHNIEGGTFKVYREQNQPPVMSLPLHKGEVALLNDEQLWHYADPIRSQASAEPGYMDVFVLTAKEAA